MIKVITEKVNIKKLTESIREEIKAADGSRYIVKSGKDDSIIFISKIQPYDLQEYHYAYSGPDKYTWNVARYEGTINNMRPRLKGIIKDVEDWVKVADILVDYDNKAGLKSIIDRT